MDIYDSSAVKRCSIKNPVSDIICKTPTASLYRATGYDDSGGAPFEAILEIAGSRRQHHLLGSNGDAFLNQLQKKKAYLLLNDCRFSRAGNPPATIDRLFPTQVASFEMSADQGKRFAALLQLKGRDWEYLIPLSALAEPGFYGSPSSFIHLMIDYVSIVETLHHGDWTRIADPNFIWVDTRNSQLIYLGGIAQYSPPSFAIGDSNDVTDCALSIAAGLFERWVSRLPSAYSRVEDDATELLAKPMDDCDFGYKCRGLFKLLCVEDGRCYDDYSYDTEGRQSAVENVPPCIIPTQSGGDTILSRSFFYGRERYPTS